MPPSPPRGRPGRPLNSQIDELSHFQGGNIELDSFIFLFIVYKIRRECW
jgi:hypothetical protein